MSAKTNDLAFTLETEVSSGFEPGEASLRLTAEVLRVTDDGIRGIGWDRYGVPHGELADLTVTGYANTDWDHTYGFHVAYGRPYSVELDRAKAMVRVLGRVERHLKAMSQPSPHSIHYDNPESYTDYLLRVAKILGVGQYVVWGERRPNGTRPWRLLDGGADGAAAWLDERLAEFRKQYPVKEGAA